MKKNIFIVIILAVLLMCQSCSIVSDVVIVAVAIPVVVVTAVSVHEVTSRKTIVGPYAAMRDSFSEISDGKIKYVALLPLDAVTGSICLPFEIIGWTIYGISKIAD